MIDLIFGVTHPEHWHSLNLRQNRSHYSAAGFLGSRGVYLLQDKIGAGMYYNPNRIKYGVVSMDRLFRDLTEWETLYLAGRLQKPVRILRDDARTNLAARKNLRSAVRTALLLLPNQFTEEELFYTIAGLSYRGDFRMTFGENPHKVYNIVYTQMDAFREIYKPIIEDLPNVNYSPDGSTIVQDENPRLRGTLIQKLPRKMYNQILTNHRAQLARSGLLTTLSSEQLEEPLLSQRIAMEEGLDAIVNRSLRDIVRVPAILQSLKGVLTAGPGRSLSYVGEKLQKYWGAEKK
ncbi:Mitochondrial translocator assembly and maintenance protein 41 [Rhizophlyctis rosea]|uniref:Phosphatidate cytidylyltransferase, mitochondrial n=1 Tax=Rhizophlyctis rosea TaxID=64517 RepID=A0AAD5S0F8_9FUNG|nr:Mitochondrial translocator assembly and maintenance protein 41 [Rhizophlyctis rosea]